MNYPSLELFKNLAKCPVIGYTCYVFYSAKKVIMSLSASRIRQLARHYRAVGRWGVALTLVAALCLMGPSVARAQDNPTENFRFSYDPVSFDKKEIRGSEAFHATITGRVTCVKDPPMSASEASLISRVSAVHTVTGTEVTLNSNYTITIKPFPSRKGETAEISQVVPLQFPAQAATGDYNVVGKIVEAKVKVVFAWVDVTGYLPREQPMGTVKYTATASTAAPSSAPTATSPPLKSTPPGIALLLWLMERLYSGWFLLIVFLAIATTIFNITWFFRHRTRYR
jgi:hypothetical protein